MRGAKTRSRASTNKGDEQDLQSRRMDYRLEGGGARGRGLWGLVAASLSGQQCKREQVSARDQTRRRSGRRQWPTFKLHCTPRRPGYTPPPLDLALPFITISGFRAVWHFSFSFNFSFCFCLLRLRLTCVKFQFAAEAAAEGAAREFRWGNCSNEVLECQSTAAAMATATAATEVAV